MKKLAVVVMSMTTLIACMSINIPKPKADILPREDGTITAVYKSPDKDQAESVVINSSHEYCKDKQQSAVFINDTKNTYTGTMDEETKKNIRKASTAGILLGGVGMIPRHTRDAGAVIGTAGVIGTIMTADRDYRSEVKFKCR